MSNGYGDISSRIGAYAEKKMLEHAEPILVLNKLGDAKPMPRNTGENIKFRAPIPLPVATTPIVEGVRGLVWKVVTASVMGGVGVAGLATAVLSMVNK